LSAFARVNPGDVTIRHHHTGEPFLLHSFRHKGYWFHGRRRERATMAAFAGLVRPGDCVLEAGGHIGYVTLYLASLAGPTGRVVVFEPGSNNLPYLRSNVAGRPGVEVVDQALGGAAGRATLYLEDLTGQNNSLLAGFAGLASNERNAVKARVVEETVAVTTVDTYVRRFGLRPRLLKIDVEGSEAEVLAGSTAVLDQHRPVIMAEVQRGRDGIAALLRGFAYRLFLPDGTPVARIPDGPVNVFALPPGQDFPATTRPAGRVERGS
jgi:FkbM family methyltransferase